MDTELQRYVDYLQRSLLSPGSEPAHNTEQFRAWVQANQARLKKTATDFGWGVDAVDMLERELGQYAARSAFDSFTASAIFEPILGKVLDAARDANIAPHRPILFANSTDISATAAARPSSSEHLLFAGIGTYAFCNYWAKIFAGIAAAFQSMFSTAKTMNTELLRALFSASPRLAFDAARFSIYCKIAGSAVGYGEMPSAATSGPFRIEVLAAMEIFAIGHEVGHCYFEERREDADSQLANEEFDCDLYSLTVSRHVGNRHGSWSAFSGAGAYALLRAADICAPTGGSSRSAVESTHPASKERAEALRLASIEHVVTDQRDSVERYLGEVGAVFDEIESLVTTTISGVELRTPVPGSTRN